MKPSAVSQLDFAAWSRFYLAAITGLLGSLRGFAWQPLARSVSCEAALTGFCFAAVSRFAACLCSLVTALGKLGRNHINQLTSCPVVVRGETLLEPLRYL